MKKTTKAKSTKKAAKPTKAKKPRIVKATKRTKNVQKWDDDLSPEADKWLGEAMAEYNAKLDALKRDWGFDSFERWAFDEVTKTFTLHFADGTEFEADGLVLGTYCPGDGSWEWAWNNPNIKPEIAVPAGKLKPLGERLGISYLQIGMVPAFTRELATYLCAIGVKATEAIGVYLGGEGPVEAAIVLTNPRRKLKAA